MCPTRDSYWRRGAFRNGSVTRIFNLCAGRQLGLAEPALATEVGGWHEPVADGEEG